MTKGFERFRAEKEKSEKSGEENNTVNEKDETADKPQVLPELVPDEVETVLRVFDGTIISDGRNQNNGY